jgi:hypothetical protein
MFAMGQPADSSLQPLQPFVSAGFWQPGIEDFEKSQRPFQLITHLGAHLAHGVSATYRQPDYSFGGSYTGYHGHISGTGFENSEIRLGFAQTLVKIADSIAVKAERHLAKNSLPYENLHERFVFQTHITKQMSGLRLQAGLENGIYKPGNEDLNRLENDYYLKTTYVFKRAEWEAQAEALTGILRQKLGRQSASNNYLELAISTPFRLNPEWHIYAGARYHNYKWMAYFYRFPSELLQFEGLYPVGGIKYEGPFWRFHLAYSPGLRNSADFQFSQFPNVFADGSAFSKTDVTTRILLSLAYDWLNTTTIALKLDWSELTNYPYRENSLGLVRRLFLPNVRMLQGQLGADVPLAQNYSGQIETGFNHFPDKNAAAVMLPDWYITIALKRKFTRKIAATGSITYNGPMRILRMIHEKGNSHIATVVSLKYLFVDNILIRLTAENWLLEDYYQVPGIVASKPQFTMSGEWRF